jgi:hypothetical protein
MGIRWMGWGGARASMWLDREEPALDGELIASRQLGKGRRGHSPAVVSRDIQPIESRPFAFEFPSVDLAATTLQELQQLIRRQFDRELTRYRDGIKQRAKREGLRRVPRKMRRVDPAKNHYNWLARFQFAAEPLISIAKSAKVERNTVSEARDRLARLLDLTLRERDRPGRPHRSKHGSFLD